MKRVKMGVDASALNQLPCGIGYYVFYLLSELVSLRPDWHFFLYCFSEEGQISFFKKFSHVTICPLRCFAYAHSLWMQTTLSYALYKNPVDIFWGAAQLLPLISSKSIKKVLTQHDFVFRLFPQSVSTLKCCFLKLFSERMIRSAHFILCNSQATADKLAYFYQRNTHLVLHPPLKTTLSYHTKQSADPHLAEFDLQYKHYFLTLGTIEPRKNLLFLLDHYQRLLKKHPTLPPLVIIGAAGWKNGGILSRLKKAQLEFPHKIKYIGHISDELLSYFLSGARYFLFFSLYEGYGMPIAEARYCRTPIVCFDLPEMRQAAEEDGIFLKEENFVEKFEELLLLPTGSPPKMCGYLSNRQKAAILAQALLDLLEH